MIDPIKTPDGQRILMAMGEAEPYWRDILNPEREVFRSCTSCDWAFDVSYPEWEDAWASHKNEHRLRAALSVTGECKTCSGTRLVDGWPLPGQGDVITPVLMAQDEGAITRVQHVCPDCIDGGEPLLVLREQAVTTEGTNGP